MVKLIRVYAFFLGGYLLTTQAAANEWQFDVGGGVSRFEVHNIRGATRADNRPHYQMGAYRLVSDSLRIGVGLDFFLKDLSSWGQSGNALFARIVDVDYLLTDRFALSLNMGFARYYREHSSYGYAYGGGVKYSLSSNWYLAGSLNMANVDLSTNVPGDPLLNPKDNLKSYSIFLKRIF